jgi:hypothetical protein
VARYRNPAKSRMGTLRQPQTRASHLVIPQTVGHGELCVLAFVPISIVAVAN